jgi:hypothetical protein
MEPIFSIFEKYIFKFQKILKILNIHNVVHYQRGIYQLKIPYIWDYTKMIKSKN